MFYNRPILSDILGGGGCCCFLAGYYKNISLSVSLMFKCCFLTQTLYSRLGGDGVARALPVCVLGSSCRLTGLCAALSLVPQLRGLCGARARLGFVLRSSGLRGVARTLVRARAAWIPERWQPGAELSCWAPRPSGMATARCSAVCLR